MIEILMDAEARAEKIRRDQRGKAPNQAWVDSSTDLEDQSVVSLARERALRRAKG